MAKRTFPRRLVSALLALAPGFTARSGAVSPVYSPLPLAEKVTVQGVDLDPRNPPPGLVVRPAIGLLTSEALDGQIVYRTATRVLESRAVVTPAGDYLLMFPEGAHYATAHGRPKVNTMIAFRSSDRGRTWTGPTVAFDIDYSQHGFVPLIPRGTKRIYAFGTQPVPGQFFWENGQRENAPIGFRWSDDDGRTWSPVKLIRPVNDPDFRGMSVMRMTETDAGTWLIGSHTADWSAKPFTTRQYLLRSTDRGETWTLLPGPRPGGWFAPGYSRMDEGRPLNLGGGNVFFMSRTPDGHLWSARSADDGKTWTMPSPTTLLHPDAPPMLFPLSDGKTLAAFHHNLTGQLKSKSGPRSEIWCSLSRDEGRTWSEPRFVFANALLPNLKSASFNSQCSYLDGFTDEGVLHLFLSHRWQQVLHLTIKEAALATLPTRQQLGLNDADPRFDAVRQADAVRVAAIVSGDRAQLDGILSPDLTYIHSSGLVQNRTAYVDGIASGRLKYLSVVYDDRRFSLAAPDIALMTGRCQIRALNLGQLEEHSLSFLSVWRREDGVWRFLSWQSCGLPEKKP